MCPQGMGNGGEGASVSCNKLPTGKANATRAARGTGADAWPRESTVAHFLRDVSTLEATNGAHSSIAADDAMLVAVATAPGQAFQQRRAQVGALLGALDLAAVFVEAVTRDMVAQGGSLEWCRPVRPGEDGLPDSYAANGLNQLQMFVHAWCQGYDHVLVLEDDVTLAPAFPDMQAARRALRESVAEAPVDYDLIFLGDCCEISERDRREQSEATRVRRWLFKTKRASRCANAFLVSRSGMQKMLLHLPVWCSLDWMMNAAKFATVDERIQTQVYVMDPPLFVEGSKTGAVESSLEPHSRARRGEIPVL